MDCRGLCFCSETGEKELKDNLLYPILAFFFFTFLFLWIVLCSLLVLPSFFLPKKRFPLSKNDVDEDTTVCWLFFEKGHFNKAHYEFESGVVAPYYDKVTFLGYGLILSPVMWALKNYNFIDRPMLFVVRRWMRIHRYIILNEQWVAFWELPFTRLCTSLSARVGLTLYYILRPNF